MIETFSGTDTRIEIDKDRDKHRESNRSTGTQRKVTTVR